MSFHSYTTVRPYLTPSPSASPLFLHFQVERRFGDGMASFLKATHFIHSSNNHQNHPFSQSYTQTIKISTSRKPLMAALSATATVGLSETFTRLKEQGKVSHSTPHSSSFLTKKKVPPYLTITFICISFTILVLED